MTDTKYPASKEAMQAVIDSLLEENQTLLSELSSLKALSVNDGKLLQAMDKIIQQKKDWNKLVHNIQVIGMEKVMQGLQELGDNVFYIIGVLEIARKRLTEVDDDKAQKMADAFKPLVSFKTRSATLNPDKPVVFRDKDGKEISGTYQNYGFPPQPATPKEIDGEDIGEFVESEIKITHKLCLQSQFANGGFWAYKNIQQLLLGNKPECDFSTESTLKAQSMTKAGEDGEMGEWQLFGMKVKVSNAVPDDELWCKSADKLYKFAIAAPPTESQKGETHNMPIGEHEVGRNQKVFIGYHQSSIPPTQAEREAENGN